MRVVIVGLGSIANKHITAIKKIAPQTDIFALRSSANYNPVDEVESFTDFSEIEHIQPDFILISNPTSEHYTTIEKLKRGNIPLFIEKPLFDKIGKEQNMLCDFLTSQKTSTYIACNLRFLDCLIEMKKELANMEVNEVNVYCGSYLPDWRPGVDYRKIYSANKEMGGGVHIDLIHELDYLYWLFGAPDETRAVFANKSSLNISAFDYANYLWTYKHFTASVILNYYRKDSKRTLEILTPNDTFLVDLLSNTIYKNGKLHFHSDQTVLDTYTSQMSFFLNTLKEHKSNFNSINEAYSILKLCLND